MLFQFDTSSGSGALQMSSVANLTENDLDFGSWPVRLIVAF
jgi:hypothetical protein